ncbi:MAG: hypothetical protein U0167_18120 [bacterium]
MRSKWFLPATTLAALLTAATVPAQTISYINFLQFDLQSFRSQATAGIFQDDVDMVGDAANLTTIEGNRLFTNFANLAQPATLGDNVLTYSDDHNTSPYFGSSNVFDSGSYLVGWIGKYSKDSNYNFEAFYQRNASKTAPEDLNDLEIGFVDARGGSSSGADAEISGFFRDTFHPDSSNVINGDELTNFDLTRYDARSAMNFDLGAARDLSEELTLGGRFFWENDQLDIFSNGRVEVQERSIDSTTNALAVDSRTVTTYIGNGEEAFRSREIGVSADAGYHPWENQDVNIRLDVFGSKLVNPGGDLSFLTFFPNTSTRGFSNPYYGEVGGLVDLRTDYDYTTVRPGAINVGGVPLTGTHENSDWFTSSYFNGSSGMAIQSVDDDRTGIGFAAKGQWSREWAGGENKAWIGMAHRGLDIGAKAVAIDQEGSSFWWNNAAAGGDRQATRTNWDETLTITRDGDMKMNTYEIGTRWNRPMNQHVSVGLGAILSRENVTSKYTQKENDHWTSSAFDDGDPGVNTLAGTAGAFYNEFSDVHDQIFTNDVNDEVRSTFIRLPVGAQFHFADRWTVNVGAQHMIVNVERETNLKAPIGGNLPEVETLTVRGTPDVVTTTYHDDGFEADATVTDKANSNHTTYWYGLSIMLTDAAQLDINGIFDTYSNGGSPGYYNNPSIFDTDFYRNLAISLKYIFW